MPQAYALLASPPGFFGSPLSGIMHSGGNMPVPMEQQQAAVAQMLRLPHQAAHQRQQHHQGAQPQRQPQARQMGTGQAQRPEAPRAPPPPPAAGPGPPYLGSATVPFIRQPQEQALDSAEGEWLPPAGRSCLGSVALCPAQACRVGWERCRCTTIVGAAACHLELPNVAMGMVPSNNNQTLNAYTTCTLARSIWPTGTSLLAVVLVSIALMQSQGVPHPREQPCCGCLHAWRHMQALSTYLQVSLEDPVQHHAQHQTSLPTLALAALVRNATMPAAQGHSKYSVAIWGGSCAGGWPLCLFASAPGGGQYCCQATLPAREASSLTGGPMPALSELWRAPIILGQLGRYTFCHVALG